MDWPASHAALSAEIAVRHYSPKTLQAYSSWVSQFQAFTRNKSPGLLSLDDVKPFLTFPAVKR